MFVLISCFKKILRTKVCDKENFQSSREKNDAKLEE